MASEKRMSRFAKRNQPVRLQGSQLCGLEMARNRVLVAAMVFVLAFTATAGRLLELNIVEARQDSSREFAQSKDASDATLPRGDILDRNGVLLATSLPTQALIANPRQVIDPVGASESLASVFPGTNEQWWLARLTRDTGYVRLRSNLTPRQQSAVNALGIPGVDFEESNRRVYPQARAAAHVLGLTSNEGGGVAGIEKSFDGVLALGQDIQTSLDVGIQTVVREKLAEGVKTFNAIGGAALIMDVRSGELIASVSLPDFDPNAPRVSEDGAMFNRVSKGVYELGSPFKLFTAAMALDSGVMTLNDGYDASEPIRVARFTISDFHAKNRWLSLPEVIMHSSNIGAAKMALDIGPGLQRRYLERFGFTGPAVIELPEVASSLSPQTWRPVNAMTASFGYGIAVTPLHMARAVSVLVNGGTLVTPTLLKATDVEMSSQPAVISKKTSRKIRSLMRLVVSHGTGSRADQPGYFVGGKTGTAEKLVNGRYSKKQRLSSFTGAFPINDPKYAIFVMLDEPKGSRQTREYATGGWVAAPVVGEIVGRVAPMLGLVPAQHGLEAADWRILAPSDEPWANAIRQAVFRAKDTHSGAY
jgi:cell division protein FtsI (penicillin-binding protein 3)